MLTLIGNDGGFLPRAVTLRDTLLMAPGERLDLIADFSECARRRLMLYNDAPAPYPSGTASQNIVMQFRVGRTRKHDPMRLPDPLSSVPSLAFKRDSITRVIRLEEDSRSPGMMRLNGKGFHDGIDEMPRLGDTEIWEFHNATDDTHPMHLHLVKVQLLSRSPLQPNASPAQSLDISDSERGWKDVVCCHPGQSTRIVVRFEPFTGQYMYHCHMLEHEDHDMMRAYLVLPPLLPT
jgi:spore coat protein A